MGFLYPRLLSAQAVPLFEHHRELPPAELTRLAAFSHVSAVYVATGGDRIPPERLQELRASVMDLALAAGFPEETDRARNAEFDLKLAALLHEQAGMVPAEAAARDVWAFLALVVLPDVAFWRYPRPPGDRVLGTDLTRHVFGRLWWRAHLVRDPDASDPYAALGILGEAAFDQIYARRAALGGSPHLVRAVLRVWDDLDLHGLNERDTLRDFLKRLLRLAPFVLFDGVEEHALDEELRAVAQESVEALRRVSAPDAPTRSRTAPVDATAPSVRLPVAAAPSAPAAVVSSRADDGVSASSPPATEQADAPHSSTESPESVAPVGGTRLRSVEFCAGCGAQALGLEQAGFDPVLLVDSKADACFTIERNRPHWDVVCIDLLRFPLHERPDIIGVDLLSAGLPRVRSMAAGARDDDAERKVLRAVVELACAIGPRAVLLENVPDLATSPDFEGDRRWTEKHLHAQGYRTTWTVLDAADFGVPQYRRSGFLVAMPEPQFSRFAWPRPSGELTPTVGQVLGPSMAARGWPGAEKWARGADRPAPALVGGSDRRGGADLGPTGSKKAWAALGVNGSSFADAPPGPDLPPDENPRLTVEQAAMIQSIPENWEFVGGKTSRYRQIGHAMPPPLAAALGRVLASALRG